jgi:hypothetical protein
LEGAGVNLLVTLDFVFCADKPSKGKNLKGPLPSEAGIRRPRLTGRYWPDAAKHVSSNAFATQNPEKTN